MGIQGASVQHRNGDKFKAEATRRQDISSSGPGESWVAAMLEGSMLGKGAGRPHPDSAKAAG